MNTSSSMGGAGREQIVDSLGRATLTEVSWQKDSSKFYCGLIFSEDRSLEHKFLSFLISLSFLMLKHQIRAYLTFWRICCAGIDIPHCLRVKNKMDKNYFKPHGLAM